MVVKQPELPGSIEWPERTRSWWIALSDTPGAESWSASDWEFLMTTALVHADIWGSGNFDRLAELEEREKTMGITPSARAKLGNAFTAVNEDTQKYSSPLDEIAKERRAKLHVVHSPRKTGT